MVLGVPVNIRSISDTDMPSFIRCYLEIWQSLKGILPDDYVNTQIQQASSEEFLEKLLEANSNNLNIFLMACIEANTVGIAWGRIQEDGSSWLSFLGVIPVHRRKGVGGALLARFIEESRSMGSRKISLDTDPRLTPAIKLYETRGFDAQGTTLNQYGLELIIYSREIK